MAIADVVTAGFGSFSSVGTVPTRGFTAGVVTQIPGIEYQAADYRLHYRASDKRLHYQSADYRLHYRGDEQ